MNRGLLTALFSIGLAQFLKIPIKKVKTGKWDWGTFLETGGMPSSHSTGVSALSTFVGLKKGMPTIDFALACLFGLIVMYDAQGIRRQTGELSIRVNDLDEEIEHMAGHQNTDKNRMKEKKLKEMLGHQPQEVLGGAVLGFLLGTCGYFLSNTKK